MIAPLLVLAPPPGMENIAHAVVSDDVAGLTGIRFHSLAQAADDWVDAGLFHQRVKELNLENLAGNR